MSTIQVRIDEKTKKSAKKILDKLGLDFSSAIKIYMHQIVTNEGIPFRILTENGLTIEQEAAINKASEEAKRGVNVDGPFDGEEAIEFLRKISKRKGRLSIIKTLQKPLSWRGSTHNLSGMRTLHPGAHARCR
ncbi:MAG: type II toxin-antitoxin system RelB/DinJ family antitoxin [Candidatus Gracilibacteria bacterium]